MKNSPSCHLSSRCGGELHHMPALTPSVWCRFAGARSWPVVQRPGGL